MCDKIKYHVEILIGVLHTVRSMNFFSRTSILLTKAVTFTEAGYQLDNLSINCDVIPDSVAMGYLQQVIRLERMRRLSLTCVLEEDITVIP